MPRTIDLSKIIGETLRLASAASITLMAVGLGLFLAAGPESELRPEAVMAAGIFMLVAVPVLRVTGYFISFLFIEKDLKYALISAGLLGILLFGLLLPGAA